MPRQIKVKQTCHCLLILCLFIRAVARELSVEPPFRAAYRLDILWRLKSAGQTRALAESLSGNRLDAGEEPCLVHAIGTDYNYRQTRAPNYHTL